MKALFLVALLAQGPAATPQPPVQTSKGDVYFVIGWQNLYKPPPQDHYNDWLNAIFYGGAGAGWYWTDNLKTQVDAGAGTKAEQYRTEQTLVDGRLTYESSRLAVRQWDIAVSQQYQFFRNQWFHPHVGAGVELARETRTETYLPIFVYDQVARVSRPVTPGRVEGPEHEFIARGLGEVGFKAYLTPRAFFTGDMRMMFRDRLEQVLFRAGFGFDF